MYNNNRICTKCLRCERLLKSGLGDRKYLCKTCRKDIIGNQDEINLYRKKYLEMKIERRLTLNKLRNQGIKKMTFPQHNATEIINKIGVEVFGYNHKRECIKDPYRIDSILKNGAIHIGIEIDGGIHNKQPGYDEERDAYLLKKFNLPIYRFKNEEVNTQYFIDSIWAICYSMLIDKITIINKIAQDNDIKIPIKLPIFVA